MRVEKSRRKRERSESCEKENRVYRELRELRTQCTSLFNINQPVLLTQFQISNNRFIKFPQIRISSGIPKIGGSAEIPT